MIFGRGGAGGVVNRVSRVAQFGESSEFAIQGGMFGNGRVTAGFNQPLNDAVAFRLDGMFENSNSFRDHVSLERGGVTPTATIRAGANTTIALRYEYLKDTRTADRGITSFQGRPADVERGTFYGNPDLSRRPGDRQSGFGHDRAPRRACRDPQSDARRELRSVLPEFRPRGRHSRWHTGDPDDLQQRDRPHECVQSDRRHLVGLYGPGAPHTACGSRGRASAHGQLP